MKRDEEPDTRPVEKDEVPCPFCAMTGNPEECPACWGSQRVSKELKVGMDLGYAMAHHEMAFKESR